MINIEGSFIAVLFYVFFDISMTYYTKWLDEQKEIFSNKREANIVHKFFMGNKATPLRYLLSILYSYIYIIMLFYIAYYFANYNDIFFMITGMYGLLFYIHILNIINSLKNWNNERYWTIMKMISNAKVN